MSFPLALTSALTGASPAQLHGWKRSGVLVPEERMTLRGDGEAGEPDDAGEVRRSVPQERGRHRHPLREPEDADAGMHVARGVESLRDSTDTSDHALHGVVGITGQGEPRVAGAHGQRRPDGGHSELTGQVVRQSHEVLLVGHVAVEQDE